jgi:hypothetical protein
MDEMVVHITVSDLIKLLGRDYRSVLHSIRQENLILSHKKVVEIRMTKKQAVHLQSVLEFHSVKDAPIRYKTTIDNKDD